MPRMLIVSGILVSVLILVLFAVDLAIQLPFGRASVLMDGVMVAAALALLVLGVLTLREQR